MNWSKLQDKNPIMTSILDDWLLLLAQDRKEKDYHLFIKDHSGIFLVDGIRSYLSVSKIKLGSRLETDFAIPYENHSAGLCWELVEIKTPSASPYNSSGNPSAKLTEAIQQIQDWNSWLKDNRNEASKLFQSNGIRATRNPNFEFTIIIGNRENTEKYLSKRNSLADSLGIQIRSFNYLTERLNRRSFLSSVMLGNGDWDNHHHEERFKLANPFYTALTDSSWKKLLSEPGVSSPHFTSNSCTFLLDYLKVNKKRYNEFVEWTNKA